MGGDWRPVEPKIGTRKSPPAKGLRRIGLFLWRITSIFFHPIAVVILAPTLIDWAVALTFLVAYQVGGNQLFGPVILGIWAAVAATEYSEFRRQVMRGILRDGTLLRSTMLLVPAFVLYVALIYLIISLGHTFA